MTKNLRTPGSALLLTVMIISILTTTTLASVAVRFDQLAATDRVSNAAVAKSAADSALVKLREDLAVGTTVLPTIDDLDTNTIDTSKSASFVSNYRPNPRKIVATYQKTQTALPRCLAVAVLIPWTNDGQYLLSGQDSSNPALLFNYANIVNDTPLGIIPGNSGLNSTEKSSTVSQLTSMGHFYNPYAPTGAKQSSVSYWTVKLGGPQDQFLTRKSTDGASSYYKNVDFLYLPYLPRLTDSGLFSGAAGTGVDRFTAAQLQTLFETTIKTNNFKVWLDASVSESQINQYGFADLFALDSAYRLKWLQPSLWNDNPESDLTSGLAGPYRVDDVDTGTVSWTKKGQPLIPAGAASVGWNTKIIKGSKPFSFIKLSAGQSGTVFSPGATITGLLYGSLEGLRLNQPMLTYQLLDRNQSPLNLNSRTNDQGRLYNVILKSISQTSSLGIVTVSVTFTLSNHACNASICDTPKLSATNAYATGADIDTIAVLASPQYTTTKSNQNVTIEADRKTITLNSTCTLNASLTACPAPGDIIDLTKALSIPVWGKVITANYNGAGTTLVSVVVDALHQSPPPTREMAYTYYSNAGTPRIVYYGGAIDMNEYDGGYASESDQLWFYNPETDVWVYPPQTLGTPPGPRAGASMVYDAINNRLVMMGGYFHEAINAIPGGSLNCELDQPTCLYTNEPGLRVAKRVTNDVYTFNLSTNTWAKLDYSAGWGKIVNGTTYTARVTSTLADRSGLEQWKLIPKYPNNSTTVTLQTDGTTSSTFRVYPSAAGVAKGDSVNLYGNKSSGGNFTAWGQVNSVDYPNDNVNITVYGDSGEASVTMSSLAVKIVGRTNRTSNCTGSVQVIFLQTYYSCDFNNTTGYAVGDSVVLEQYSANDAQLTSSLSGFISYIDSGGKAYFVADEKLGSIRDFSDKTLGKVAGESAVAFPSGRYGAAFSLQPTAANRASYWEGAATNLSYNHRFADLWNVQFVVTSAGCTNACTAVWSFQTTDNVSNSGALANTNFTFQVIRPNYTYQLATTTSAANNPAMTPGGSGWDNAARYQLQISSTDEGKLVTGAWATLEQRSASGSRQTFHGIVDDIYSNGAPASCGSYANTKLCLHHNPAFPDDTGFSGSSANVSVTLTPSYQLDTKTDGTFKGFVALGTVTLKDVTNLGAVPGIGAMVQIWADPAGNALTDAYTFIVNDRSFNPNTETFTFTYDKLTASPDPLTFSSSQITSQGGTNRLLTMTDSQMNHFDKIGAPEWVKDANNGGTDGWNLRLSGKYSNYLYRPANRRGAAMATLYDASGGGSTKTYLVGGALAGQYATIWREQSSGATSNAAAWDPRLVSATAANDVPLLAGGSVVVYKVGLQTRMVFFGGKQETNLSNIDYGRAVGPFIGSRPDINSFNVSDNTFSIAEDANSAGTDAANIVNSVQNSLPATRPGGVDNSVEFHAGYIASGKSVCPYLGQASGCNSKQLLSQLGNMGRLDQSQSTYNGWSNGRTPLITDLGTAFKQQTVGGSAKPSLILSTPTLSGTDVNGRYDQEGYRPYLNDTGSATTPYGTLNVGSPPGPGLGSSKTAALVAYSTIGGGGAVLVTASGVGAAVTAARGGSNDPSGRAYSYCAANETTVDGSGNYACNSGAVRMMSSLPDAEDILFTLTASLSLASTDSYKVVGFYGGAKRGYIVVTRTGAQPTVYEVAP